MNLKYSIKGQIISVILEHLKIVFVFFAVWILGIYVTASKIGGAIYSYIATFFYFTAIYSAGYQAEINDKKSYSPLTPKPYKGALLSLGVLAVNIALAFSYLLVWKTAGNGESLTNLWAVAVNVLCLFWFSPFMSFLGEQKGAIAPFGYIIIFILPTLSCFLGYFAAYKNFDILQKLRFLVYEKKKK